MALPEIKYTRVCSICKEEKHTKAFVGHRPMCRVCWYYLNKEKRKDYIVYVGGKDGRSK